MAIQVYGIKNCDTMKKTFAFLEAKGVLVEFIDFKKLAPTTELLQNFISKVGLNALVNKQGTTYKKMEESQKFALEKEITAIPILIAYPSMIKRPVIVYADKTMSLGFSPDSIASKLF